MEFYEEKMKDTSEKMTKLKDNSRIRNIGVAYMDYINMYFCLTHNTQYWRTMESRKWNVVELVWMQIVLVLTYAISGGVVHVELHPGTVEEVGRQHEYDAAAALRDEARHRRVLRRVAHLQVVYCA